MTVIPDSITPKVGWRAWSLNGTTLHSPTMHNEWPKGEAFHATCYATFQPVFQQPYMGSTVDPTSGEHRIPLGAANERHMLQSNGQWLITREPVATIVVTRPVAQPPAIVTNAHGNSVPGENCGCGVYATTEMSVAKPYGEILGRVALWGTVVEHSSGYRGEYAYPQALYVPDNKHLVMKAKLAGYGVPVLKMSEIGGGVSSDAVTMPLVVVPSTWYVWPVRVIGVVLMAAAMLLQFYGVLNDCWWAASGNTMERQVLGTSGAFAQALFIWWYLVQASKVWRWHRD